MLIIVGVVLDTMGKLKPFFYKGIMTAFYAKVVLKAELPQATEV